MWTLWFYFQTYTYFQFDPKDLHYDPKSKQEDPRWWMVDVRFVRQLRRYISLKELKRLHLKHKTNGGPLAKLSLFTSARLSVQPIREEEFDFILTLENKEEEKEEKESKWLFIRS